MSLLYLSRGQAALELTYVGDQRQLETALAQRDLALAPEPSGGGWVLQRRGG